MLADAVLFSLNSNAQQRCATDRSDRQFVSHQGRLFIRSSEDSRPEFRPVGEICHLARCIYTELTKGCQAASSLRGGIGVKVKAMKPATARLAQCLAQQLWPLVLCYAAHTRVHLHLKDPPAVDLCALMQR